MHPVGLVQVVQVELGEHLVQVLPVQHVELDEAALAAAHALHGRLVARPPGQREGVPVETEAARGAERGDLARDAAAPVDDGAEDIEGQGFHVHGDLPPGSLGAVENAGTTGRTRTGAGLRIPDLESIASAYSAAGALRAAS